MQKSFVSRYNIDRFVEKTRAVYEGIDRVKKPLKPLLLIFFAFAFYQLLLSPEEQDKAVTIEHEAKAATLPDELHPTVAEKAAILIERLKQKESLSLLPTITAPTKSRTSSMPRADRTQGRLSPMHKEENPTITTDWLLTLPSTRKWRGYLGFRL